MGEVVDLTSVRKERQPHWAGVCYCVGCRHTWAGVGELGVTSVECPECGTMRGVPRFPFGPSEDEMIYVCGKCGGDALFATLKGGHTRVRCMGCGTDHTDGVMG